MMTDVIVKVISKSTIEMFESEVRDFYCNYSDKYNIEAHYSTTDKQFSVLLIARCK